MNKNFIQNNFNFFTTKAYSMDYFKTLIIILFCLTPISHKSIEIIRYIFIALSLTQIKLLKNAILSRGSIILCLFILVAIASNIVNNFFFLHIDRPLNWLIAYLIGYFSILYSKDKKIIEVSTTCLGAILMLQFIYKYFSSNIPTRYSGSLIHPNHLAILILLPIHYYTYKTLTTLKHSIDQIYSNKNFFFYLFNAIFLYYILIKTGTRTTLILNTLLLLILPCFIFSTKKIILIVFAGIFSLSIVLLASPSYIKQRFVYSVVNYKNDPSFQERFPIWFSAMTCISKNPILGGGMDSFRKCYENNLYEYMKLHPNQPYIKTTNNAHNFFLHFLVETGILGLLLISSLFFMAISYALSINNYKYLAYALFGSLCGFMMNMNFYIREISTLLMVIIGWIFALQLNNDTTEQQRC